MAPPPAIVAIERFLDLVLTASNPSLDALSRSLDALALAVADAPTGQQGEADYPFAKGSHPEIVGRFKLLGFYPIADPIGPITEAPMMGDSIDDIQDIVSDLEEVLWRYKNVSADDAYWHLHFLFRIHWGRHLRELSLYLHVLMHYS